MVMVDDSHAVGFVGAGRPRHARALRRDGTRRHHHRHARQGARRRERRATPAAARRSSTGCASARGPTSSATRWHRPSRRPRCRCWSCCSRTTSCNASSQRNATRFRAGMAAAGFTLAGRRAPDHPGDARRRDGRRRDGRTPAGRGRLRDRVLASRSCRRARRASARRCPPRTATTTSTAPSRRSPEVGREMGALR